jgi:hypothetical protein
MEHPQIYLAISIIVLAVVALFAVYISRNPQRKRLTPLAGLAFGFILAGLFLGDNRMIGYSLIGVGIILSVIDIVIKFSRSNRGR